MRNITSIILTLLLFSAVAYFLFPTSQPAPEISAPPLEIIEQAPPLIVIEADTPPLTPEKIIQQDADTFIDTLSKPKNIPIIISEAQGQFVSPNNDIILLQDNNTHPDQVPTNLRIQDILNDTDLNNNDMFYLHQVTAKDQQGLWGIIQHGLVEKFRTGLSLEGISTHRDSLQVVIPADADERLTNGLSSFLGKLLSKKVSSSYSYNLETKILGRNPNIIQPGQQLVLIKFSPDELKSVYQFFAEQRQHVVQTYGIPD